MAMDYYEWLRRYRAPKKTAPRKVVVSGEPSLGDFSVLTAKEWHALIVERRYHESHACDDR